MKDNEFHLMHFTQITPVPNSSRIIGAHLWEHYHIMNAANDFTPMPGKINVVMGELPPPAAGNVYQNIQNIKPIDGLITTPQGHKMILSKKYTGVYYCEPVGSIMNNSVVWKGQKMIKMRVEKKDIINPNWTAGRLKSEIAEAYKNMTLKGTKKLSSLQGESVHRLQITWESYFSDGQKIDIVFTTKNNVAGQLYYNPWNINIKE